MSLTFEPGIGSRNRCLRDHLATRIYADGLVAIAGKLDLSASKLTEKLAGSDSGGKPRGMTVDELEDYIAKTNDVSPIHYLVDKYLQDPGVLQAEALAKLATLAEQLPALMAAAGLATQAKAGRQ
jgi:hypothetical protein